MAFVQRSDQRATVVHWRDATSGATQLIRQHLHDVDVIGVGGDIEGVSLPILSALLATAQGKLSWPIAFVFNASFGAFLGGCWQHL